MKYMFDELNEKEKTKLDEAEKKRLGECPRHRRGPNCDGDL